MYLKYENHLRIHVRIHALPGNMLIIPSYGKVGVSFATIELKVDIK